jgi:hypothetical protein
MKSQTDHFHAYQLADRVIGSLLDFDSEGIILSIDIGGSLFDTVARNAAKASRHHFVNSPSLVSHRSQRLRRSPQLRPSDVIEEPVLFGRVDGKVHTGDDSETFESYGPQWEAFASCSIDSWAAGRRGLRLIHFGDPALTLDQFTGATKSLARDRPLATFYTSDMDRRELLSRLELCGYQVLNLNAEPVHSVELTAVAHFGWIAIPAERYAEVLAGKAEPNGHVAQVSEWQEVVERNTPARLQRSRSVFGLPASTPLLTRKFTAGELLAENDCYPLESDGISSWRWIGPRPRTRFFLPCALPGIYQLEIIVIANHLRDGLGECRVLVEGREVQTSVHGGDQGTIAFVGQLEARDYTGFMTIDVVTPGNVSAVGADPRVLRLNIQSIAVSPWR